MANTSTSTAIPSSDISLSHHYGDLVIGCILAVAGNLLISISLNLQKLTHMRNEKLEVKIHYTRNPLWWLGVSMMIFGEVGNFSAYGYAPASLVAPLGTTTVIANMFLAAVFLKEKIKAENLFGSALAIIGAILIVAFSQKKEDVLNGEMLNEALTQTSFIVYVVFELSVLGILFMLLYYYKMKRIVIYLLIVAIIASFSVISAKAVSSMIQLTLAGNSQMHYPLLYIMIIIMFSTAVIQVKYLNQAMKNFESTVVVPTNFVFFTISAIVAGIVFFKEFWGMSALEIFVFLVGCIMSFVGVYFIVAGRGTTSTSDTSPLNEGEEEPRRFASIIRCFPSWLCASYNVGQVQPQTNVSHSLPDEEEDRRPFLAADGDGGSSSSQETLYTTTPELNGNIHHKKYGAND